MSFWRGCQKKATMTFCEDSKLWHCPEFCLAGFLSVKIFIPAVRLYANEPTLTFVAVGCRGARRVQRYSPEQHGSEPRIQSHGGVPHTPLTPSLSRSASALLCLWLSCFVGVPGLNGERVQQAARCVWRVCAREEECVRGWESGAFIGVGWLQSAGSVAHTHTYIHSL